MKTFLNVLYRRILYRIPLKFLLILLAVCAVFIASFSSAVNLPSSNFPWNSWDWDFYRIQSDTVSVSTTSQQFNITTNSDDYLFSCFRRESSVDIKISLDNSNRTTLWFSSQICTTAKTFYIKSSGSSSAVYSLYFTKSDSIFDWLKMTSLECQTEYNLIPISSVDENYCTTNNLCPSSECPVCPVWTWWVSSVYINDILHVGSPFIYMNIPEEIDWDYAYTQWWTNMNIDIVWYNQDPDKINGIITIQNYKPNSQDFTSLVSNAIPLFVPWLCIILLLYFIFRFIKKIF